MLSIAWSYGCVAAFSKQFFLVIRLDSLDTAFFRNQRRAKNYLVLNCTEIDTLILELLQNTIQTTIQIHFIVWFNDVLRNYNQPHKCSIYFSLTNGRTYTSTIDVHLKTVGIMLRILPFCMQTNFCLNKTISPGLDHKTGWRNVWTTAFFVFEQSKNKSAGREQNCWLYFSLAIFIRSVAFKHNHIYKIYRSCWVDVYRIRNKSSKTTQHINM